MHQEIGLGQVKQIISQEHILLKIKIFGHTVSFSSCLFQACICLWRKNGYFPHKTMTELGCGYASMSNQQHYA